MNLVLDSFFVVSLEGNFEHYKFILNISFFN